MTSAWHVHHNNEGRAYYYNSETKVTTWTKPSELVDNRDNAIAQLGWTQHSHNGRPYWHNKTRGITTWTTPDEVSAIRDAPPSPRPTSSNIYTAPASEHSNRPGLGAPGRGPPRGQTRAGADMPRIPLPSFQNTRTFATPQDAEDAFFTFLKSKAIKANFGWKKTMETCVKEDAWRYIDDPRVRKLAVEKYLSREKEREESQRAEQFEKSRADFRKMLRNHREIVYNTRWKTARPLLERETVFRATEDEEEQEQFFFEHIAELRAAHDKQHAENVSLAKASLKDVFDELGFDELTAWKDGLEAFMSSSQCAENKIYESLDDSDILSVFIEYITARENEAATRRKAQSIVDFRQARKARDGYRQLLQELLDQGKITPKSEWSDIYPLIEEEPRMDAMQEFGVTDGVDALTLLMDKIVKVDDDVRKNRRIVFDILDDENIQFDKGTSLEDLKRILQRVGKLQLDDVLLSLVYKDIQDRMARNDEKDREYAERKIARRMDDFRHDLKRVDPPIRTTATWADVRPQVERLESFRVLEEEDRTTAFNKFMVRLKEKEKDRGRHADRHEADAYSMERKQAQLDRERNYHRSIGSGRRSPLQPPPSRSLLRDDSYSRADPRDRSELSLDYGDGGRAGSSMVEPQSSSSNRRRAAKDDAPAGRSAKRVRLSRTPEQPAPAAAAAAKEEEALKSGSEEGEIEEV